MSKDDTPDFMHGRRQGAGEDSNVAPGDIYTGLQFVSIAALTVAITLLVLAVSMYQS